MNFPVASRDQSTLTAISLKLHDDENDSTILVCDSKSRQFYVVNSVTGKTVRKFRTRKSYLNENYQLLVGQVFSSEKSVNPKFALISSQYVGSTVNDLRMCQISSCLQDCHGQLIHESVLSVLPHNLITINNAAIVWHKTQTGRKQYKIFVINTENFEKRSEYEYEELQGFHVFDPFYIACEKSDENCSLVHFSCSKENSIDKIAILKLDDNLLGQGLADAKFAWKNIYPDVINGYPQVSSFSRCLSVQKENRLFFAELKSDDSTSIADYFDGIWLLKFNWIQYEFCWLKIPLNEKVYFRRNAILFINKADDIFLLEKDDKDECIATEVCSMKVNSLKFLAEKILLNSCYQEVVNNNVKNLKDQLKLPNDCFPFDLFSRIEIMKDVQFSREEQCSVVICMLHENQFLSFCQKRLSIPNVSDTLENLRPENGNKFLAEFKSVENKMEFLKIAETCADERYTAQIVEIYDYCSAYSENIEPIYISVPWDMTF